MKRKLAFLLVLGILALAPVWVARAYSTPNLTTWPVYEDRFYNYDGEYSGYGGNSIDWPVTMVFYNNATVDKVKARYWGTTSCGTDMFLAVSDGGGMQWDSDHGTKDGCSNPTQPNVRHMRVYAVTPGDRMYNAAWGYYVLATTHWDKNEFYIWLNVDTYGWSEEIEEYVTDWAWSWGLSVADDAVYLGNPENDYWQGKHFYQSNGYASIVDIP